MGSPQVKALKKVLIANRGEIAIRISAAAQDLGLQSVAVFAPVDQRSLHTERATQACALRADLDPVAAYLDIETLINIARDTQCDCVHPGYGFLSERADFASACEQAGLTFIGPSSATLALFGDKLKARKLAVSIGIPVIAGSDEPLTDVAHAERLASEIGYPIMLKASAGGGGRGMRAVAAPAELAEAFARASSEAAAAFGNGDLFMEQLVQRPRHIEVQILADASGKVSHLFERDCSIQLRHQKVIEIAPAANLPPALRARLHDDALRLAAAANYRNAGTVEFLLDQNNYYFIECNPRIQVEHTVTEQITGVDLLQTQIRIAQGSTLADLGLESPRPTTGFSVQARVVAEGPGTLVAYKEPAGIGIRVDGCGYTGYTPAPQYDPLFAKVIGSAPTLEDACRRTARALSEFHIQGLPTNIAKLCLMLGHADVISGNARTTLLQEVPDLLKPASSGSASTLLNAEANGYGASARRTPAAKPPEPGFAVLPDHQVLTASMAGDVIEVYATPGSHVQVGQTLLAISSMKMETMIQAPCSGTLVALLTLEPGQTLVADQIIGLIKPAEGRETLTALDPDQTWQATLSAVTTLQSLADQRLASDSEEPGVVRQRSRGKLHCRARISLLLDEGSFREVGSVAGFASHDEYGDIVAFTPANHVGGWGEVDQRTVIVCADDFTSRGGHADGAIGAKSTYLDRLSLEMNIPSIRLLDGSSGGGSVAAMVPAQKKSGESKAQESTGAIIAGRPRVAGGGGSFLPGHLGSSMYTEQLHTVPVVNMLLGSVVGIGAAKAVLGHFSVMVRDIAQLFVAGPPVVSHAMGYDISKEDLGGWHIHCTNGSVDNLAETEEEACAMAKRFLSYLPGSVFEAPPVIPADPTDPPDRREEALFTLIPRKRTTTFDVRRAISLMADRGSFFEIGPLWGTDQVTGFVRFNGRPLGVIASDSQHANGGALTADGCDKLRRHLDLCDLFHIPILNLIDNPGFAVGLEHEIRSTIRKGGEWMVAFAQVTVPIFTVIMRRSFGVAGNNYATPRSRPSVRVSWPAADVGGIPPEGGIEAAYKRQLAEAADPVALRAELDARIESVRGPLGPLSRFQIEEMIDPRDTRRYICEWVETAYRIINQPARLKARPLQFRP
ncbi:MAG: hypothetical protein O3A63_10415 [Proteobacteria bacterium]|nr:hypothetical protein [Pseudomonadota bacterium]